MKWREVDAFCALLRICMCIGIYINTNIYVHNFKRDDVISGSLRESCRKLLRFSIEKIL